MTRHALLGKGLTWLGIAIVVALPVCANATWTTLYETDFAEDPGWTTTVPGQMFWDEAGEQYYIEIGVGGGQYAYVPVSVPDGSSFRVEYDLTMVRVDYAAGLSIGLTDGSLSYTTMEGQAAWAGYGRGDGGTGATVAYVNDTQRGGFPGPYDFIFSPDTTYGVTLTYYAETDTMEWLLMANGTTAGDFSATDMDGFSGLTLFLVENVNNGGTAAGHLDNLRVSTWSVPDNGHTASMALTALLFVALLRRVVLRPAPIRADRPG